MEADRVRAVEAGLNEEDGGMPHEALSYTWGGTGKQLHIVVNSKGLQVTNNLYEAFLHLRHTDRERSLTQGVPACHLSVRSFRAELAPPVLSSFPLKSSLQPQNPIQIGEIWAKFMVLVSYF